MTTTLTGLTASTITPANLFALVEKHAPEEPGVAKKIDEGLIASSGFLGEDSNPILYTIYATRHPSVKTPAFLQVKVEDQLDGRFGFLQVGPEDSIRFCLGGNPSPILIDSKLGQGDSVIGFLNQSFEGRSESVKYDGNELCITALAAAAKLANKA